MTSGQDGKTRSGGTASHAKADVSRQPPHHPEPEQVQREVQRKIGRNLLLFQQLEDLLKFLSANGQIEGYTSELASIQAKPTGHISVQSMGPVAERFIEVVLSSSDSAAWKDVILNTGRRRQESISPRSR